ncbi:hypothetical protein H4582DRAFT_2055603 [Lactarius indigo]|nr:hypothetical protein H4582DRAFT_2055603 [Lactarius indigo]
MTLRSQLSVDYTTTVVVSDMLGNRNNFEDLTATDATTIASAPAPHPLASDSTYRNENIFGPHIIQSSDRRYFLSIAALDPIGVYGNTGYASTYGNQLTTVGALRSMKPKLMAFQWPNEAVIGKPSTSWRRWAIHEEDSPPHTCH